MKQSQNSADWLEPIWNTEVPQLSKMSLHVLSGLDPLFSLYHSGRIISFTLEASKRTMYQAMQNKQIYREW
jgi:hypothetical protein